MSSLLRIVGTLAALAVATEAHADGLTIGEKPGHITEASVTVDATPAEVYALVTDYANWRNILSDIRSVKLESGGRRDARVKFRSAIFEHEVTVAFDNEDGHTIRFRGVKGPPGGRASGWYVLSPVDGGKRTLVTASLYMDVVGVPGIFITNARIRSMRQAKLRTDLGDLTRWFVAHHRSPNS